ncbi:MAG: Hpt domain-containing protein [Rhizobiales bacterium]|nr:Hpt domain-containing protein [Hyphomicrobiales bacterium]
MVKDNHDVAGSAGSAVLDLRHLDKYTAGDAALRRELLSLFTDQLAQQVTALRGGCAGDDWVIATHTLKGAARAVGAFQIGETAEALEQLDPDFETVACAKLIDMLVKQTLECKAVIEKISHAA